VTEEHNDETRQHGVPDDQPTEGGGQPTQEGEQETEQRRYRPLGERPTEIGRVQPTRGYEQLDETATGEQQDETVMRDVSDETIAGQQIPPPPPPPGYGEQPPPPPGYEQQPPPPPSYEEQYATQPGGYGYEPEPPPPPPPSYEEAPTQLEQPVGQAAVTSEPTPDQDDEFRWHTAAPGRSKHAETDAVEFIDVKKSFGRNTVLNGLNLGLPEGQISMILGPSGTGKSVCIKHMVGLLYPDDGDVLVHGESVPNMADDDLFEMRKKFGVLFQDGALFGSMNLYDNVAFPLRQHTDKGEDEIAEIVNRRLKEVGLAGADDKMPNELSGGMRKRAGFARALVLDPQIVLFDEPDSGLDPVRTALLCELISEIHEENGGAYCVITHDIMSARRVAEYIAILWKGRIVESGPAEELFNSENQFVRQFLSGEARGPLGME
jgi:phospholipid/cholesterol/gamma-HCH transport system ATP-binding protein